MQMSAPLPKSRVWPPSSLPAPPTKPAACVAGCRLALQVFAQGLFQAGYRDRAAAVYYHLLISGSDRTQQAQLLKRCLACWTQDGRRRQQQLLLLSPGNSSGGGGAAAPGSPTGSRPGSAGSSGGEAAAVGAGGGSGRSGAPGTADADLLVDPLAAADPHVFEKLVLLFEGQAALGWGQIIDMAGEAGLGQEFVARCVRHCAPLP